MTTNLSGSLPQGAGVYLMRDVAGKILYIGKAVDLRQRVSHYFRAGLEPKIRALMAEVGHIDYVATQSEREALIVEQRLIHRHQPPYNTMWKDGKTYPWVCLSGEDFPRLFLTRQRRKDKGVYFGPYPHVSGVRHLLNWVWKQRLFSLRPCDLKIDEGNLYPYEAVKSCLYLHTGDCPAPCLGKISKQAYAEGVDRARLFFSGQGDVLERVWEAEMKTASDSLAFERAAQWRDSLMALRHVNERVTFRALREEEVQGRIQTSQALQEIQKALGLLRPPDRIECFDISHHQGDSTVASLVCFRKGEPDKKSYRKFIIKTVVGVDDFASMAEVVSRRYQRVKEESAPWPDLILVDGGKGQLSAAHAALGRVTSRKIPLVSLAKREEEVYTLGAMDPLVFSRESPALQLLQRVRDEAHRFAVTFHRARRKKTLLGEGAR